MDGFSSISRDLSFEQRIPQRENSMGQFTSSVSESNCMFNVFYKNQLRTRFSKGRLLKLLQYLKIIQSVRVIGLQQKMKNGRCIVKFWARQPGLENLSQFMRSRLGWFEMFCYWYAWWVDVVLTKNVTFFPAHCATCDKRMCHVLEGIKLGHDKALWPRFFVIFTNSRYSLGGKFFFFRKVVCENELNTLACLFRVECPGLNEDSIASLSYQVARFRSEPHIDTQILTKVTTVSLSSWYLRIVLVYFTFSESQKFPRKVHDQSRIKAKLLQHLTKH